MESPQKKGVGAHQEFGFEGEKLTGGELQAELMVFLMSRSPWLELCKRKVTGESDPGPSKSRLVMCMEFGCAISFRLFGCAIPLRREGVAKVQGCFQRISRGVSFLEDHARCLGTPCFHIRKGALKTTRARAHTHTPFAGPLFLLCSKGTRQENGWLRH